MGRIFSYRDAEAVEHKELAFQQGGQAKLQKRHRPDKTTKERQRGAGCAHNHKKQKFAKIGDRTDLLRDSYEASVVRAGVARHARYSREAGHRNAPGCKYKGGKPLHKQDKHSPPKTSPARSLGSSDSPKTGLRRCKSVPPSTALATRTLSKAASPWPPSAPAGPASTRPSKGAVSKNQRLAPKRPPSGAARRRMKKNKRQIGSKPKTKPSKKAYIDTSTELFVHPSPVKRRYMLLEEDVCPFTQAQCDAALGEYLQECARIDAERDAANLFNQAILDTAASQEPAEIAVEIIDVAMIKRRREEQTDAQEGPKSKRVNLDDSRRKSGTTRKMSAGMRGLVAIFDDGQ